MLVNSDRALTSLDWFGSNRRHESGDHRFLLAVPRGRPVSQPSLLSVSSAAFSGRSYCMFFTAGVPGTTTASSGIPSLARSLQTIDWF